MKKRMAWGAAMLFLGLPVFLFIYKPYERLENRIRSYVHESLYSSLRVKEISVSFPNRIHFQGIVHHIMGMGRSRGAVPLSGSLDGTFDILPLVLGRFSVKMDGTLFGGNVNVTADYGRRGRGLMDEKNIRVLEVVFDGESMTLPDFRIRKMIMPVNRASVVSGRFLFQPGRLRFEEGSVDGSEYKLLLNGDLDLEQGFSSSPIQINLTYKNPKGIRLAYSSLFAKDKDVQVRLADPGKLQEPERAPSGNKPVIHVSVEPRVEEEDRKNILERIKEAITHAKRVRRKPENGDQ